MTGFWVFSGNLKIARNKKINQMHTRRSGPDHVSALQKDEICPMSDEWVFGGRSIYSQFEISQKI